MANDATEVDPEKMQAEIDKMCKEIDAIAARSRPTRA
jgi:hypothetical protein